MSHDVRNIQLGASSTPT